MADLSGTDIDRYHIIEPLGQGGMAIVYKAYDNRLERDVAVKLIRRNAFSPDVLDKVLKRFDREAKSLAKLTHPNIVSIIDYGEHDGSPYLVMPYLPGGTLKQYLGSPMPFEKAAALLTPIADALAFAHQKGIIHRDVKPANILITEGGQPMLTDFGIARLLETGAFATITGTGVGVGTPEYMSPEQGMGREVDGRTDIYSLGVVLYELITGNKPYTADTPMAVVLKQSTEPLPKPSSIIPSLPEKVDHVLYKALNKNAEERYQSMDEFLLVFKTMGIEGKESPFALVQKKNGEIEDPLATKEEIIQSIDVFNTSDNDFGTFEQDSSDMRTRFEKAPPITPIEKNSPPKIGSVIPPIPLTQTNNYVPTITPIEKNSPPKIGSVIPPIPLTQTNNYVPRKKSKVLILVILVSIVFTSCVCLLVIDKTGNWCTLFPGFLNALSVGSCY